MAVRLSISERGDAQTQYVRSFVQDRILLGRARSADVCLPDMAVSTRHAEIRIAGNDYAVVDLSSVNGTKVNGNEIVAHRPRVLRSGDSLSIANFQLLFTIGADRGALEPRDASTVQAREMLAGMLARSGADVGAESSKQSLNAIFEAPEENTSTFAADALEDGNEEQEIGEDAPADEEPLPIGPEDPLLSRDPVFKRAEALPQSKPRGMGDLSLMIVGAVIVVAAVAGLVYLFR